MFVFKRPGRGKTSDNSPPTEDLKYEVSDRRTVKRKIPTNLSLL